jgi:uncharacterized PurR-regulated membrane protein YhhQ (DUF165 family)
VKKLTIAILAIYGASIVLANYLIKHVGMEIPGGTHLVPVGLGLMAPSGTFAAGLTLIARDLAQRTGGKRLSLAIIVPGVALSALIDIQVAIASGAAFVFGELADFAVYSPLQRRGLALAVFASAIVGSVIDSVIFLNLAGIPLTVALPGLVLGKFEISLAVTPIVAIFRRRLS